MKILISDKLADEGVNILTAVDNFTVDCKFGISADELKACIGDYDGLIIRSGTTVTAEILEKADNLKFIGRAGVGLDNVDLEAATKKGVVAMNTPGGNTTSTAEHTMSMILALSRNIPQAYLSMKNGKWDRAKFKGVEVYGKKLGIIGFGRIGSTVAKFAKAFGMEISVYDPYISEEAAARLNVTVKDLEGIYKDSDYITVHIPKTEETANMIGKEQFAMMKKSTRLINCARGGIINEAELAEALENNVIAGAALDVYETEPPDMDHPLFKLDNCVTSPHLGASTSEAQLNVAIEIAETVRDALLGKGIVNAANFPSVDAETYQILEPYIHCGRKLGKFAGQLVDGAIQEVNLSFYGPMTKYKVAPVTFAVVSALLKPVLGEERVNEINALDVARERSIKVQETKSSEKIEYSECIQLSVKTDKGDLAVWGTLSTNKQPRIVKIDDVSVEAVPDGNILYIHNNDKPGLVGAVGTVLGEAKINIAEFSLSRESEDGSAITLVRVDDVLTDELKQKLGQIPDIRLLKVLTV